MSYLESTRGSVVVYVWVKATTLAMSWNFMWWSTFTWTQRRNCVSTNLPEEHSEGGVFSYLSDAGVGVSNLHDHRKRWHAHLASENRVLASFRYVHLCKDGENIG